MEGFQRGGACLGNPGLPPDAELQRPEGNLHAEQECGDTVSKALSPSPPCWAVLSLIAQLRNRAPKSYRQQAGEQECFFINFKNKFIGMTKVNKIIKVSGV